MSMCASRHRTRGSAAGPCSRATARCMPTHVRSLSDEDPRSCLQERKRLANKLTKEMNRVMMSYGLTPCVPTMPSRMTLPGMHVLASSRSTPMTGEVSSPNVKCHRLTSGCAAIFSRRISRGESAWSWLTGAAGAGPGVPSAVAAAWSPSELESISSPELGPSCSSEEAGSGFFFSASCVLPCVVSVVVSEP